MKKIKLFLSSIRVVLERYYLYWFTQVAAVCVTQTVGTIAGSGLHKNNSEILKIKNHQLPISIDKEIGG